MDNPPNICPQCHSPIPADAPGGLCPACVLLGVAGRTNPSQAAAAAAPTMEEVAAAFPDLEVLDILGQGGMGIVFKARQPRLDRFVALKVLPPALAAHPGFSERFTREARVLARLAHPNIVSIYDFGESAGFFYLIMEFVNGVNLRAAMRAGVTPEQALLLVPRICEALQFAHDHGVLHRDIKPENILLDTAGVPKLADFGIAKLAGEESGKTGLTATGAALGTAVYMAPEQVEKPSTVDHRADIYSLGVVLYEMLTGELPLGRFAAPSEKSTVNRGVDDVVMRALEKERERRQQSATDLKTQVEGASHPGIRPAGAPHAPALPQDNLLKRIFRALCVLSAVGIPMTAIMRWETPGPQHMVVLTILFGTLAGLSKMFASEIGRLLPSRPAAPPALPDPTGTGRKVAIAGLLLMLFPLAVLLLALPWLSQINDRQHGAQLAIAIPLTLAGCAGVLATLVALFVFRFRAPWFFACSIAATIAAMFALNRDHRFGFTGLLGLGVIGYCIFHFREFFPAPTAAKGLADPAPNPWPHRLVWLVVSLFVLPGSAIFSALLLPMVSMRHGHFSFFSAPLAIIPALLPFLALVALHFGYRRTQPGADQATPRATWNPWPKRVFQLVLALVVLPMTLIGFGVAIPLIAYRGAERPALPPKLRSTRALPPAAAVVTAERRPFIGALWKGSIELVGISPHPGDNEPGWQMNGSPATEGPFVNRGSKSPAQSGQRAYNFVFRTRDLPPGASSPTWKLPDALGWGAGGAPFLASEPETPVADCTVISATFPKTLRKTDVRMGIATLPWQTISEGSPQGQATKSFSHEKENWVVTQGNPLETKDGETVVTYTCSVHENWETRVVARNTEGREIPASRSSIFSGQSEWRFERLPLANIQQFQFQIRRYEWVEFRDVALASSKSDGTSKRSATAPKPQTGGKSPRNASGPNLRIGPTSLDVHYGKVVSNAPGIYELILNSRTPSGWITDFSCRIRDEKGERELPTASFLVARNKASDGKEFPAQVSWEFTTRDKEPGNFHINAKALPGEAGIASSSTSSPTPFRWEIQPERDESTRPMSVNAPLQIPFLRTVPVDATAPAQPGAEIFIAVSLRPMRPGEKTRGLEAILGEDRFEQLATEKVEQDKLAQPAAESLEPAGASFEMSRLQDENIRVARERLEETKARFEAGVVTSVEQAAAERNLAVAEARGDELKTATALLAYAEVHFKVLKAQVEQGTATSLAGLDAEQELNAARIRLEKVRAKAGNKPDDALEKPAQP
jgi:hypothetical protein